MTTYQECQESEDSLQRERWNEACDLYDQGFHITAMQLFTSISGHSITFVNRGIILSSLLQHDDALKEYETAKEMGHCSAICDFLCGISQFALGHFDAAVKSFDEALGRLNGLVGINYKHVGLDYTLFSLKVLFNKGASLALFGQPEGQDIMANAAADIKNAKVPDDRIDEDKIYSLVSE